MKLSKVKWYIQVRIKIIHVKYLGQRLAQSNYSVRFRCYHITTNKWVEKPEADRDPIPRISREKSSAVTAAII